MTAPTRRPRPRDCRAAGAPVRCKRTDSEQRERGHVVVGALTNLADVCGNIDGRCATTGASWRTCQCLACVWCRFLGRYTWGWFGTFTFRREIHPEAADKKWRVWLSQLNRELYGARWWKHEQMVRWVRALETQRRGVIHYHGLIGGDKLTKLKRLEWMDRWHRLDENEAARRRKIAAQRGKNYIPSGSIYTGYARIEPPMSQGGVRGYVSKYLTKGGEIDIGGLPVEAEPHLTDTVMPAGRDWQPSAPLWWPASPDWREIKQLEDAALTWRRDLGDASQGE